MGPFILAVVAAIGIGYGASIVFEGYQKPVGSTYVGSGAKPDAEKVSGAEPKS